MPHVPPKTTPEILSHEAGNLILETNAQTGTWMVVTLTGNRTFVDTLITLNSKSFERLRDTKRLGGESQWYKTETANGQGESVVSIRIVGQREGIALLRDINRTAMATLGDDLADEASRDAFLRDTLIQTGASLSLNTAAILARTKDKTNAMSI